MCLRTDRQANGQTGRQAGSQTIRQANGLADSQAGRGRQASKQPNNQTNKMGRQAEQTTKLTEVRETYGASDKVK